MKKVIDKVVKSKPSKWIGNTAKHVFSENNMKEFGIPVMTGFTLFAGLDAIGNINEVFNTLGIPGTSKLAAYSVLGPGSKVACFAAMEYDRFANTNYKQIIEDFGKEVSERYSKVIQ